MACSSSVLARNSVLLGSMFQLQAATVSLIVQLVCDGQRAAERQYKRITEDVDCREATMSIDDQQVTDELLGHYTSRNVIHLATE